MKALLLFTVFCLFGTAASAMNQACSEYCRCSQGHVHLGCGFFTAGYPMLIPLNEEAHGVVASLKDSGQVCFKGSRAAFGRGNSGYFAYEVHSRN